MHATNFQHVHQQIDACRSKDRFALRKRLLALKNAPKTDSEEKWQSLLSDIQNSQEWVKNRQTRLPAITFDEALPINQKRQDIAALIAKHQVVVVAGETGSGKTTQIPKICLSLGLGNHGLIGHTQPRRIAARTVATRIAEELNTPLGDVVGYQVRFNDQVSENSRVKLMTDGVLLAELQRDRFLNEYEVIIIDEAHERSLNIDFLLGLLKRLLKQRPDLKLIITSATIDVEKFSQHFDQAPVIEVSGRTFPVEVIYQPDVFTENGSDDNDMDLPQTICHTVEHIIDNERQGNFIAQGDILVFCTGERDIRDAAKALQDANIDIEILPLYARLSMQEQTRVFKPTQRRKVVLATNVAETSITVPGIAYVIDPGLARISRYNFRSKVQGLPIERISQASANQRMGRCGRVANGVCIRLYSEEDFLARAEFTEAELLRSNLASVILQMLQMGIRDIQRFPFIDQPDNRLLNDGFKLLEELQALQPQSNAPKKSQQAKPRRLSNIGYSLSRLPVDPKYARMLYAANRQNCLQEMLIIIAALSIQDPREWPAEKRQAAQEKHALLNHKDSDFIAFLNLWETINQKRKALSNKQFKDYCSKHFLSIVRIFEWRDMVSQLSRTIKQLDWTIKQDQWVSFLPVDGNSPNNKLQKKSKLTIKNRQTRTTEQQAAKYSAIHQALLSGLLGNIACSDIEQEYLAARGRKLAIFPTSTIAPKRQARKAKQAKPALTLKTSNQWIMANELMETSRLFAVTCAKIESAWINAAGKHLLRYSYSNPEYHQKQGMVKAKRHASLYGLRLSDTSSVVYSDIDPTVCRELFIQRALVEGAYADHPQNQPNKIASFFAHNQRTIAQIEAIETKTRRRNLLISDVEIFRLYDELIPKDIVNYAGFEQWRKNIEQQQPQQLCFSTEQLTSQNLSQDKLNTLVSAPSGKDDQQSRQVQFPDSLTIQGKTLALSYHFHPGDPQDGVTLSLPVELLAPFPEHIGSWLVPGLLREKCIALIKTLPKQYRKLFAPAAAAVDRVLPKLTYNDTPLHIALGQQLSLATGHKIPQDAWQLDSLDDYYQLNYRLLTEPDSKSPAIIQSRDLLELKQQYAQLVTESLKVDNAPERRAFEQDQITAWNFGELPDHIDYQHQGMTVRAFPMLTVNGSNTRDSQKTLKLGLHESAAVASFFTDQSLIDLALLDEKSFAVLKQSYRYLGKEVFKPKARQDNLALQLMSLAADKQQQTHLKEQVIRCGLKTCCFGDSTANKSTPNTADVFYHHLQQGQGDWVKTSLAIETLVLQIAQQFTAIKRTMSGINPRDEQTDQALQDCKDYVYECLSEHFLDHTTLPELQHFPRYLQVTQKRLENLRLATPSAYNHWRNALDQLILQEKKHAEAIAPELREQQTTLAFVYYHKPEIRQFNTMLREWYSSLFAQQLRTQFPISEKRIEKFFKQHFADSA